MARLTTYIIGDSGHAHDIADDLRGDCYGTDPGLFHFVPHHSEFGLAAHRPDDRFIIGINDHTIREAVAAEIGAPGLRDGRWVHHRAYLNDVKLGTGVHVNYAVHATRATIGDWCTIAPGVLIGGDVTIGDRCLVGMGAIIGVPRAGEHITIGDDVTIGAGAVVLRDIPEGTWVGNPARRIK